MNRVATYANDAGRSYTAPLMLPGDPPTTHTLADGTVLTLRMVHSDDPKALHGEVTDILSDIQRRNIDKQQARQRAWNAQRAS